MQEGNHETGFRAWQYLSADTALPVSDEGVYTEQLLQLELQIQTHLEMRERSPPVSHTHTHGKKKKKGFAFDEWVLIITIMTLFMLQFSKSNKIKCLKVYAKKNGQLK